MADESLGHIEIRFPEGESGGGSTNNSEIVAVMRDLVSILKRGVAETQKELKTEIKPTQAKEEASSYKKVTTAIESLKGVYKNVASAGSVGEGVSAVKGGISELAPLLEVVGLVGTAAVAVAAVIVIIIAVLAILVIGVAMIWKGVSAGIKEVLNSIDRLSNVSGAMAMEKSLNTLQQMQLDIKEAQVLGPIYSEISGLYRRLQSILFPFIMVLKTFIFAILKYALEKIISLLEFLREVILSMLRMAIAVTAALASGGAMSSAMGNTIQTMGGITGSGITTVLGWLLSSYGSGATASFAKMTEIMLKIYGLLQNNVTTTQHPNDYFSRQLQAMSGLAGLSKNQYRSKHYRSAIP